MIRRPPGAVIALAGALLAGACGPGHSDAPGTDQAPAGPARDTLRGIVAITGSDPLTTVVIRTPDGATVAIRGALADTLRQAAGLDVRLAGTVADGAVSPRRFLVRGMEGLPAADGTLELDADTAVLVTADGARIRYPMAPRDLRLMAGRRVWIAAHPGAEPQHWGALDP